MKKLSAVAVLAVAAALFASASGHAQVIDPYYTFFGVNKIAYDTFNWKTYRFGSCRRSNPEGRKRKTSWIEHETKKYCCLSRSSFPCGVWSLG